MDSRNRLSHDFNDGTTFVANTSRILRQSPTKIGANRRQNARETPALSPGRKANEKGAPGAPFPIDVARSAPPPDGQRLENWNERRAFARPYFLRSTTRGSRVRKPPRLSTPRRSGSY